jgi:hypothetical protein
MMGRVRTRALSLGLLTLAAAPSWGDNNVVNLRQVDTGGGGSLHITQLGQGNALTGPSSLSTVTFDTVYGLHSYAPIVNSGALFTRSGQVAADFGSDGTLFVEQEGNDNRIALTGAAAGQNVAMLMFGDRNAVELLPSSSNPDHYSVTFAAEGDDNKARLRPQPGSTIALEIVGNRNEFILNQTAGAVDSSIAIESFGDEHAARVLQYDPSSQITLTFLGDGVGPIELKQYGGNITMTFESTVSYGGAAPGAPFTLVVPE